MDWFGRAEWPSGRQASVRIRATKDPYRVASKPLVVAAAKLRRKFGEEIRKSRLSVARSGSKQIKLLSQRRLWIAGVLRLSFPHHMNHLNTAQDHSSTGHRLEAEHRPDPPLDSPMILLDPVVETGTLPDSDRIQRAPRSILEPVCHITGHNGFAVGLAAVDHDPLWTAVPLQGLPQKAFGSGEISPFAEPELDGVTIAVDCPIEIPPLASDFE
jgi:hypothetical protein